MAMRKVYNKNNRFWQHLMLYVTPNYQCFNTLKILLIHHRWKKQIVEEWNAKDARLWPNVKQSSTKLFINLQLSRLVYRSRRPSVHVSSVKYMPRLLTGQIFKWSSHMHWFTVGPCVILVAVFSVILEEFIRSYGYLSVVP